MRIRFILIFLIATIYVSSAVQFSQIINGNGELYTNIDIKGSHAAANGKGNQGYILYIESDEIGSRMDSVYRLKNATISDKMSNNSPANYYMISMDRSGGMYHSVDIHSTGSIDANNTVINREKKASTTFNFSSQGGIIEEQVFSFDNKKHRQHMIETRTNGSMDIYSSHLIDDTEITGSFSSEADQQLNKLESAKLSGETGRIVRPVESQETIYQTPIGYFSIYNDSNFNTITSDSQMGRPKFVTDSLKILDRNNLKGIDNSKINYADKFDGRSPEGENPRNNLNDSDFSGGGALYKEEENELGTRSYRIIVTKDGIYSIESDSYEKHFDPILNMLANEYNINEPITDEDIELIITEENIYSLKSEIYEKYFLPILYLFGEKLDGSEPATGNGGDNQDIWAESSSFETDDGIMYLPPYILSRDIEENPEGENSRNTLNDSDFSGGGVLCKEEENELGIRSYRIIVTKDGIYSIESDSYEKHFDPILNMLANEYNINEPITDEDIELIITEENIYSLKSEIYEKYFLPILYLFGEKLDGSEPATGNGDNQDIWAEVSSFETDDGIFYLGPNIYRKDLEEKLGIEHPNTTIDAYRLGKDLQRVVETHVGRKARTDYFQSKQVRIPNSTRNQGNITLSGVYSTRSLEYSY